MSSSNSPIDSLRGILFDSVPDKLQEKAFNPVFRVVSQNNYKDTDLGTKLVIDTIPADVRMNVKYVVRDDYQEESGGLGGAQNLAAPDLVQSASDIVKKIGGSIKDSIVAAITGKNPADDRPLIGCMVDMSHRNPYPWANIIFHNPTESNPRGDQLFGTDKLKLGFPIWVYAGYIDQGIISGGNIVGHPFMDKKLDHIPLIFSGFIGALIQEIKESGDRMIIQAVGYEWYLTKFRYIEEDGLITFPTLQSIESVINSIFEIFYEAGGGTMPDIIAKAMRLDKTERCKPTMRYVYGATPTMIAIDPVDIIEEADLMIIGQNGDDFRTILNRVERSFRVDIDWDVHGYLTIRGRDDPFKRVKKFVERDKEISPYPKLHEAILGGNVRNWEFAVDVSETSSGIILRAVKPGSGEAAETHIINETDIAELIGYNELGIGNIALHTSDDYFHLFGANTKALEVQHKTRAEDEELTGKFVDVAATEKRKAYTRQITNPEAYPWSKDALAEYAKRLHYWGMRGSAMIMGNASVREGDLVRVTDIRPKGDTVLNMNLQAARDAASDIAQRVKDIFGEKGRRKISDPTKVALALEMFDNVYYIWKVRQYVGPTGFWTKIWFIKQRDAYKSPTNLLREIQERSGAEL